MKKPPNQKTVLTILTLILILCLLTSCGAAAEDKYAGAEKPSYELDYGYGADGGFTEDKLENSNGTGSTVDKEYAEKIIREVNMVTETRDFDDALAEIRANVSSLGGYEQSVSTTGKSYNSSGTYCRVAKMVLRIPAEKLDEFLNEVGDLVNVTNQSTNSTNVTTQYYDIKSRIGVLESEKEAYEEMLKTSTDVSYLLEIKDRLYNVIEEIESYETQLRLYDSKVSYSTVTMSLEEVIEYSQITTTEDTFGTRISRAFVDSWKSFATGLQSFAVLLVYAIPTLLLLAFIAGGTVAIVLTSIRHSKKKKHKDNNK